MSEIKLVRFDLFGTKPLPVYVNPANVLCVRPAGPETEGCIVFMAGGELRVHLARDAEYVSEKLTRGNVEHA